MGFERPPEVNIGMIGHVDHGKTTLTQRLTGKWTDEHSEELKRGISIRLGYADAAFYKCTNCEDPTCYTTDKTCTTCGGPCELLRVVSFVDAPGHETLMATMLSGAAIMDGAVLVIAANEKCPQPQTREHLMALEISGTQNIIIVQNKIDLVSDKDAMKNYEQIKVFVKGTCAENAPVIPVSAHHDVNIDVLIKTMQECIPTREHDMTKPPLMYIARSFDVNRPGAPPKELKGGVVGGSLMRGRLKKGEAIEISPGRKIEVEGKSKSEPILTTARSFFTGGMSTDDATPGGLLAIGTDLDPSIVKSDSFSGKIVGKPGELPPMLETFDLRIHLLKRVVGTVDEKNVEPLKTNEPLMLTVGTATTVGIITELREDRIRVTLKLSVCAEEGQRIAVSRRIEGKWHLIGYGEIQYINE
ncbi:MAG: translation initiation factor IF-2 subunit gamma [Candidatus Thermoplasmatota archaeon]|nr:translation initiation factor IF-2 subunit gamma [Candidatus Thermoplasmatota archaeon]MBU1940748.1 translation initiation factor IF-2 subunit gamma [Candidatus Thermoplasmatota archaeon]